MKKQLSSLATPVFKLVPILVAAWGAVALFGLASDFDSKAIAGLMFLALWCGVGYLLTYRWKSVHLEGSVLHVSNYLKRVEIPLADVGRVEASSFWGWHPRTVKLILKSPSEFGSEIIFVAGLIGFEASEVADELRALIGRSA